MARLFAKGFGLTSVSAEQHAARTTCASCGRPYGRLYDERREHHYCDSECLTEYIAEHAEEFAEEYAEVNVTETD